MHETAILLHTSKRGKKDTREGKKGAREGKKGAREGKKGAREGKKDTREGKKGAREGKKGAREGKKGAAPFYFGLAGTLAMDLESLMTYWKTMENCIHLMNPQCFLTFL